MLEREGGTVKSAFVIGDKSFSSKAAVTRHVQSILKSRIGALDEESAAFMGEMFLRHPSAAEKIGPGIHAIHVAKIPPFNTTGFRIERVDGTWTDASYLECLSPTGPHDWFRAACRTAVVDQIIAAKIKAFPLAPMVLACPITGEPITRETCHADHEPPWTFDAIVREFLDWTEMAISDVRYIDGDNVTEARFIDADLTKEFAQLHADLAVIRMVSKRANLSLLRRGALR